MMTAAIPANTAVCVSAERAFRVRGTGLRLPALWVSYKTGYGAMGLGGMYVCRCIDKNSSRRLRSYTAFLSSSLDALKAKQSGMAVRWVVPASTSVGT